MLAPASWLPIAETLALGARLRTNHDCGGGRTLTVRKDADGLHAFCFRCNDHGWKAPAPEPLEVRLARLNKQHAADTKASASAALPQPAVREWAKWPPECRLWLLKAGLCSADLPGLGAYYHPPSQRVVLPVLGPSGRVLFWQARAVDKRQPKYLAPPVDKASVIPSYGTAHRVTLTEDLLSAYKVGQVGEGWSMLGTSINDNMLAALLRRGCAVNVWLDPDPAGQRGAAKVLAKLRAVGLDCRNIISKVDPKLVHLSEIKELIT